MLDNANRIKVQFLGDFCVKTDLRSGGWSETGIYDQATGKLVAVITHPCAGAKWSLHFNGRHTQDRFTTKRAALARVVQTLS